jgi:predicted transcriptional regulator
MLASYKKAHEILMSYPEFLELANELEYRIE